MQIQLSEHFNYRKLIRFTIPTIIMMIFTSIYGVIDGLFISNFVGSDSFAAINLIMPVLIIVSSIGFMFGTGGSALVSKILGEGDTNKANEYFSLLTYLLIFLGTIFSILGVIFMKPLSSLLGAKGHILDDATLYGIVITITMVPYLLQNYFQSFLVVAEKPILGLVISICAGITNMILDFVFIYIFKMSIFGAALASSISQIVGGIIPLIFFIRKNDTPLKLIKTKLNWKAVLQACMNGLSEMLTNISASIVTILFNIQLMKFAGYDGVVAYGIIMYISFIFSGIYIGYSVGSAPIVSYHYGAGNNEELKNLFKKSLELIAYTSVIMTVLAEIFAKPLASMFVSYNKELLEMTVNAIRIFAISYFMSGFSMFTSSFFTALNNGVVSATISFLRTLVIQIVMILLLPAIWGLNGIWFSVVVTELISLGISVIFLICNRKKYKYI